MPAYAFEIVNGATGEKVGELTAVLPVDQRDSISLRRITVPRSVTISGSAPDKPSQAREVMKGFHDIECKKGSRAKFQHPPEVIKKTWANDK